MQIPSLAFCEHNAGMGTIDETRLANLEALITEAGSIRRLAEASDTSEAYLGQIRNRLGDSRNARPRNVGDALARKLEAGADKPVGWMDVPHAREERASYNVSPLPDLKARPVISWVKAGAFDDIIDQFHPGQADEWETPQFRSGPRAFWLRVDGDSMTAPPGAQHSFTDGTLIHCDPDIAATPGRFVIAKDVSTQRATFKLLTSDGFTQFLKPLNPGYPTTPIDNGNIRMVATVTEWRIGGKL